MYKYMCITCVGLKNVNNTSDGALVVPFRRFRIGRVLGPTHTERATNCVSQC